MVGRLQGKSAIVTGGGTGIGEAIAHKFAHEGAQVVVNGLPTDPIEDVARAIREAGGTAVAVHADVTTEEGARRVVEAAVNEHGKLDILVNNAGVFLTAAETQDYPLEDFEKTLRNNLHSVFLMTKLALPHLQETRGCILSAGSEAGYNGLAMNTPYGGTKAWIHSFMQGVAVEQARYGVRANCVCPGPIDTAWTHKETGPMDKEMEKQIISATPLGRRGTPEEVANVYAFLASDDASYVTGALWLVDGGITVAKGPVGDQVPRALRKEPEGPLAGRLRHGLEGLRGKPTHTLK